MHRLTWPQWLVVGLLVFLAAGTASQNPGVALVVLVAVVPLVLAHFLVAADRDELLEQVVGLRRALTIARAARRDVEAITSRRDGVSVRLRHAARYPNPEHEDIGNAHDRLEGPRR